MLLLRFLGCPGGIRKIGAKWETDLEKAELNGYNYLMISELIVLTRVLVRTAGELVLSTMVDIFLPGLPTCTLTERLP